MAGQDFYQVLGVNRDVSQEEIRKVYRKLARKYHPDVNPGDPSAADTFKEISRAYQILGDSKKRDQYDRSGMQDPFAFAGESGGGVQFGGFDFGDLSGGSFSSLFSEIFSQGRQQPDPHAGGSDIQHPIRIRFEDAFRGREISIDLERGVVCKDCFGSGREPGSRPQTCSNCNGKGIRMRRTGFMRFSGPCESCGGRGQFPGAPCARCNGQGIRAGRESIRVKIPPGVDRGSQVRVSGKGHAGRQGSPSGDLYLLVEVEPHSFFRRLGENLYCEIPITFPEAALGTKIEVPTMDGGSRIRVPPGTQNGQRLRLRGRGFPSLRSKARGDLFVEIRVVTPSLRDERSKEILREFQELNPGHLRSNLGEKVSAGKD